MARLKVVIQVSRNRYDHHELRCFFEDLNQALRRASGGMDWVVEGGRIGRRHVSSREQLRYQYVCQLQDPANRRSLIDELLRKYELTEQATLYEATSSPPRWTKIGGTEAEEDPRSS